MLTHDIPALVIAGYAVNSARYMHKHARQEISHISASCSTPTGRASVLEVAALQSAANQIVQIPRRGVYPAETGHLAEGAVT
jgi:hypothetical protein